MKNQDRSKKQNVLDQLKAGNKRFVEGITLGHQCNIALRQKLVRSHHPYAAVLTCSDSRVAPELIFDARLGDLFVVRVAGNVLEPLGLTTLELAVAELNIPVIIVMGHTFCKAISTAIEGVKDESYLAPLVRAIAVSLGEHIRCEQDKHIDEHTKEKATEDVETKMTACVKQNAIHQAKQMRIRSPILQKAIAKGLKICPAYYDLASGEVYWL